LRERAADGEGAEARAARRRCRPVLAMATAVLLLAVGVRAWVTEDAYISFRTVDNFVHGHGLRWNVDERVQAFTHPLWVLLLIPFHWVTREIFFTSIGVSLAFTAAAFRVGLRSCDRAWLPLVALIPLTASKAFCDFATSGLENPLTFLFLAAFTAVLLARAADPPPLTLCLLAALAATNRLDALIFFLPALAWLAWGRHDRRTLGRMALGFLPLFAWEAFSLFYFGFLFPNTKYAKLGTGLDRMGYVRQGLLYAIDLVVNDPVSAGVMLVASALALNRLWASPPRSPERREALAFAALAAGLWAYAAYVVWVGGDFMAGRFWAPGVFLAALLVYWFARLQAEALGRQGAWAMVALMGLVVVLFPRSAHFDTRASKFGTKIMDERAFYADTNTLVNYASARRPLDHPFSQEGLTMAARAHEALARGQKTTWATALVGMLGYHAGPEVIVIDRIGLGDPLLARLPLDDRGRFPKPGHFIRALPDGYERARQTGVLDGMHPALAQYYEALRRIVSDPLFSPRRLGTIVAFNLGRYDHLRDEYVAWRRQQPAVPPAATPAPTPAPTPSP
jgi:arabinofuranosyltransferase